MADRQANTRIYTLAIALVMIAPVIRAEDGQKKGQTVHPYCIEIVDDETGRGVPLVELSTVNEIRYVTDSNGIVAFDEPGLLGHKVFFHIKSHGYEFPKDGFGYRGIALETSPGGSARIKIQRLNIARRLYRVTGQGIYRDSFLTGTPIPIIEPTLNGQVLGQDSVLTALFEGKIFWFWGDTNRPGYPLGNFHSPGATSELPGRGGLDPSRGVNLSLLRERDRLCQTDLRNAWGRTNLDQRSGSPAGPSGQGADVRPLCEDSSAPGGLPAWAGRV